VPVPVPVIEKSRVQVRPDGSIAPINGAERGTSVPQVKPPRPNRSDACRWRRDDCVARN